MTRFIKNSLLVCACIFASIPVRAQTPSSQQRDRNAAYAISAPHAAPLQFFASTDPKHRNEDYITLKPNETRRILLATGELVRLWSTASEPDKIALSLANPTVPLLAKGKAARGTFENKTYLWNPSTVEFRVRREARADTPPALVVVNHSDKPNKWFYQVAIRPQAKGTTGLTSGAPVPSQTRIERATGNIAPQTNLKLVLDAKFPSLITALRVKFDTTSKLENLRLRVSDAGETLVDVPLAPLVGSFAESPKPLRDAMTNWDGKTLELHWPMPFAKPLSIELLNSGVAAKATIEVDIARVARPNPFQFHAAFGSARSVKKQAIPILQVAGAGAFVGLRMAISPAKESARRAFAFLEGNEILVADGKKYEGTGTEDFFNSAWYFPDKPFAREYGGLTEKNALPPRAAMYRLMLSDAIAFKRNFSFDFEHGNGSNFDDLEYRWVAFWYQKDGGTAHISDALAQAGTDSGTLDFARSQTQNSPNGVRSNSTTLLPPALEIGLGVVLFVTCVLSLAALFRRPKKDSSKKP